jgi:hypothetical protein
MISKIYGHTGRQYVILTKNVGGPGGAGTLSPGCDWDAPQRIIIRDR